MPREILVDWTAPSGGGKLSVFYFSEGGSVVDQRSALATFLAAIEPYQTTNTTWRIRTEGRELDSNTGTLTGLWTHNVNHTGTGDSTTASVADTSQLLVRWITATIIDGRLVKGRTFIPGIQSQYINLGNVAAGVQTAVGTAANTFAGSTGAPVIWHRPKNGAGGSNAGVTGASVWSEFAVLRRRRG